MISRAWLVGSLAYCYKNTTFSFRDLDDFYRFVQIDAWAYVFEESESGPEKVDLRKVPAASYVATIWTNEDRYSVTGTGLKLAKVIERCQPGLKNIRLT